MSPKKITRKKCLVLFSWIALALSSTHCKKPQAVPEPIVETPQTPETPAAPTNFVIDSTASNTTFTQTKLGFNPFNSQENLDIDLNVDGKNDIRLMGFRHDPLAGNYERAAFRVKTLHEDVFIALDSGYYNIPVQIPGEQSKQIDSVKAQIVKYKEDLSIARVWRKGNLQLYTYYRPEIDTAIKEIRYWYTAPSIAQDLGYLAFKVNGKFSWIRAEIYLNRSLIVRSVARQN